MILLPLVVYPLLAMLAAQVATGREKQREERPSTVAVVGTGPARALLGGANARRVRRCSCFRRRAAAADVEHGRLDVLVELEAANGTKLTVVYDASRDESRIAEERLSELARQDPARRLRSRASSCQRRSVAPKARLGGYLLSKALPLFVVLMVLLGAFYPAIDVTAGERERGTLETVLCSPIRRFDLMLGKVLAVAALATLTGVLNLASMAITLMQILRLAAQSVVLDIPWGTRPAEQPGHLARGPALRGRLRRAGRHRAHLQGGADAASCRSTFSPWRRPWPGPSANTTWPESLRGSRA